MRLADGDLKPQNVLATLDGRTFKVSDFGNVLRLGATAASSSSSSDADHALAAGRGGGGSGAAPGTLNFWGTPEFMAPE